MALETPSKANKTVTERMWHNDLKETVSIKVKTKIPSIAKCGHWPENRLGQSTLKSAKGYEDSNCAVLK